ncbi:ribosome maturation factor RimM [Siccirubricoccus deserti]|uniref:Ribosome maturation factor RimM n=1 Tax=Siccirubricoccus deserti TaxID=2013562 RepID=A0A9X0UF93_9PROT|nr:ribosome maturation factor RimM [Siccirubricoccus deserti]MBC4017681.1 16S rRNA processing protein RimM [Siccirubricoccus deserti]GGC55595.1 ribosome maturation factor RimM [Siccirubricoccus deserti]
MSDKRILVGEIGRPHGVRGLVRLRSFTADPGAIADYGPLTDATGTQRYAITVLADGLARIEGVTDRDAAQRMTGTKLYVERRQLPPPEPDEFYLADLVGLRAETPAGQPLGAVRAVEDHGAGSFLVLDGPPERLLPFNRAVVPEVDLARGRLVVVPPDEVVVPPAAGERAAE